MVFNLYDCLPCNVVVPPYLQLAYLYRRHIIIPTIIMISRFIALTINTSCVSVKESMFFLYRSIHKCNDGVLKFKSFKYNRNASSSFRPPLITQISEVYGVVPLHLSETDNSLYMAYGVYILSLIHISEPTRLLSISYAVFCLKKK